MGNHTLSSGDFFSGGWMLLYEEVIMVEASPHITMQRRAAL